MTENRYNALRLRMDRRWPPRGPCGVCGGPDARHRLWDSVESLARSSDGIQGTARWYEIPASDVRLILAAYAEARRLHRPLPGRA